MLPRNFTRIEFRKRRFRYSLLVFLFMFILTCVWTGYILQGEGKALLGAGQEEAHQLTAEIPGLPWVGTELIWAGRPQNPGAAVRQFLLEAALPGKKYGAELLNVSGRETKTDVLNYTGVASGKKGLIPNSPLSADALSGAGSDRSFFVSDLEEDYTLYTDPYAESWPEYPMDNVVLIPEGNPRVLIYHTHNSEAYTGDEKRKAIGGVISAGRLLTQTLEGDFGIKTAHSEAVNDRPDFTKAYINSQQLLKQYVNKYPNMEVVIDLHRDAGMNKRQDTLVKIEGVECAKLLLVMGDAHEGYKTNLAFARKIQEKADELYPGLMKPLRIANDRRYNQQLHPHAILLEVGSDLNTADDAANSVKFFARVVAEVLQEGQ
ncbi:MAG: stage II sporulation protein P [Clostridiales bacterium]